MIDYLYETFPVETPTLPGSRYTKMAPGRIIGTLTVSLDYTIKHYLYAISTKNYRVNDRQEFFDKIMSLVDTFHTDYLVHDYLRIQDVYFEVKFNNKPEITMGFPRTERYENGMLRAVEYEPHTITLTGLVYGYKLPIQVQKEYNKKTLENWSKSTGVFK